MQIESKIRNIKGRTSYLNQRPRRTKSTCASSPFDSAKVVRNTETAKRNLEKLAEKYKGINNVEGFLNDLWLALGLHNQGGNKKGGKPSRYALYQLQDGTKLSISIRASAHNANANKYVEHPPVPDINLSIVLQKKMRKNQFKSNPSVNIGEYVYVNQKIQNVESPLSQIANSLIGFLSNGEYNDTTGVAIVHGNIQTPQEVVNNQTLNCNRNMNKKLIRLTESDLHRIVKESVNKALNKSNSVFYDDRPSKITKVDRSNSSNKHTMSPDEIEKIHNIVSEVSVAPNGFKHRFDPNKRDGDFPLEQPEWTKDPRWQGWNGEDPEWIMKQQEKYPYGGESKQSVRVSEAQLHQIVKESVEQVLSEGFFDKFRRTANAGDAYKGLDGDYSYSKDNDRFYYYDKYGNKHDTGIGYGKGTVGTNWNPFSKHFWNGGDRQVTQSDANFAKMRLKHFNDGSWGGKSRQDIDYNGKRAYDKEQERKRQEAWREQQRREEENNQRYRAERPHRIGNTTDQYGHIRAYFDDDAAYDAGLR